jgi:MFS family permease
MIILSVTAVFATALGPILAANTLKMAEMYHLPVTKGALLTGYFLLGVGFAGTFFVPSARKWGKRHLFILGTVLLVVSSAWAGATGVNYTSMLWARIIQGVANAPFEALVNVVVGDLYFVHVRTELFPS